MTRFRRFVAVLMVAAGSVASVASEAAASGGTVGIRLLDAPADRKSDPRARLYVVDHLAAGAHISRRVEISNGGELTRTLRIYAASATVEPSGFTPGPGRADNELTGWMAVTPPELALSPGAKGVATVTIDVPADASAGERYAVIWAEQPATPGSGVLEAARAGVRVYLSVGGAAEPAADFAIESLTAGRRADGRPVVQATVRNTGGRAIDVTGALELDEGPGGLTAGPFPVSAATSIGIHGSGAVSVVLDAAIPAGPWRARLTLESGTVKRSASAQLNFPAGAGVAAPPVVATPTPPKDWPAPFTLAGAGLASGSILMIAARRRLRKGP